MENQFSQVEKAFIHLNEIDNKPNQIEKVKVIEVKNIYDLGKIVALSFIEWIKENPHGVVSLPTGRTPEYFIK